MTRASRLLLKDALHAMREYHRARKPDTPNVNGIAARLFWGARMRMAADAWAHAEEHEATAKRSNEEIAG